MASSTTSQYKYVGERLARTDGREKATGAAVFASDVALPGMLHAKLVRSPLPHARIVGIDTSKARRLAGVRGIVTGEDLPPIEQFHFGTFVKDQPVLARDRVRFVGEEVAAVAATDPDIAAEAASLIGVEYEELPAVFDPLEALVPGAPRLHPRIEAYRTTWPNAIRYGNVATEVRFAFAEVERDFDASDHVLEETFRTQSVHQVYLEPRCAVAAFDGSGRLTVWCSTQSPFEHAKGLAVVCGLPLSQVRVIGPRVGGAFGGKLDPLPELYAALLARKTERPVRLQLTRQEELTATNPRHPSISRLKVGVLKDGRLTALDADVILDSGAYANHGPGIIGFACSILSAPYKFKSYRIRGRLVYTNKLSFGAFRGYGNPQVTFARESMIDRLAEQVGTDPIEFRLVNAIEEGHRLVTGQEMAGITIKECLDRAARAAGWHPARQRQYGRGMGVACMVHNTGLLGSSAVVKMHEDGSVVVLSGAVEIGSGQEMVLAQIAAEELGVPLELVRVSLGDTETCPYDFAVDASRITYSAGMAVKMAAGQVRRRIQQIAADHLEVSAEDLELRDGWVVVKGSPERGLSLHGVAGLAHFVKGGPIISSASYLPEEPPLKSEGRTCEGHMTTFWPAFGFAAQIAEVQVDGETGLVRVQQFVAAHDVGRAVNPVGVEGQIEGALAQGLGYGTFENLRVEAGRVVNPSLADYPVASALDVPRIVPIVVEQAEPTGPFGAKGVGEPGLVATAPAIANAVYDAVGVRINDLPLEPGKVFAGLLRHQASSQHDPGRAV